MQGLMCLAQGYNTVTQVKLEPATPQSQDKHSTTEPTALLINPLCTDQLDSSFRFVTINLDSPLYIPVSRGVRCYSFQIIFNCILFLKIFLKMWHYAAFHLGLHCLQKYSFRGFPNTKG